MISAFLQSSALPTELLVVVCWSAVSIFSPVLFDHLSFKTLTTRKRKQTESFKKVFHESIKNFFCFFPSSSLTNGKILTEFSNRILTMLDFPT